MFGAGGSEGLEVAVPKEEGEEGKRVGLSGGSGASVPNSGGGEVAV